MATELLMPKLGLTMQEGTITDWVVASGVAVTTGTVVMTIETDKVEAEVEAEADGVLSHVAAVGDTLECGELAGWLLADDESPPASAGTPDAAREPVIEASSAEPVADVETSPRSAGGRILASPKARRLASERGIDLASVAGTGPGGRITSEDLPSGPPTQRQAPVSVATSGPRFVPYVVRALAQRLGVDITAVVGSGPDGRVTRADVYAASGEGRPTSRTAEGPQPGDRLPLSGMRGVIAERMASSLAESAQLSLFMDVNMDRIIGIREQLRDIGSDELGAVPGYTDFVVAAVARALREYPIVNSSLLGDAVELHTDVHVGVAVALDDGLVVPVVRHADILPLPDLALETSRLAEAARSKQLTLDEMEGGTIAVTALGMFGVDGFTPIINQPNTAIVGVGRIRDDVAWTDHGPERTSVLTLSLTWDHRAFDGAPAAQFAGAIRQLMENPLRLMA